MDPVLPQCYPHKNKKGDWSLELKNINLRKKVATCLSSYDFASSTCMLGVDHDKYLASTRQLGISFRF